MLRAALLVAALALVIAVGACGGGADDDAGPAPYDVTVGEFIGLIRPEKQEVLEAFVAQSEACEDVKVGPSFALVVTAAGLEAESASPLPELIEENC